MALDSTFNSPEKVLQALNQVLGRFFGKRTGRVRQQLFQRPLFKGTLYLSHQVTVLDAMLSESQPTARTGRLSSFTPTKKS